MGMQAVYYLVIGLAAGWSAERLMRSKGYGLLIDLIVGVAGSFAGEWLFGQLKISFASNVGPYISALICALLFLLLIRFIKGR